MEWKVCVGALGQIHKTGDIYTGHVHVVNTPFWFISPAAIEYFLIRCTMDTCIVYIHT